MTWKLEEPTVSRVLIVDDDEAQLQTLSEILGEDGFEVITCVTAREAVDRFAAENVDVGIVDLRLPDVGDVRLLDTLAEVAETVPLIIHTAHGTYQSAQKAVNVGAFAYIEKESDPAEVVRQVRRALRMRMKRYAEALESEVAARTRQLQKANDALRREITERKQTEEALVNRESQLEAINELLREALTCQTEEQLGKKCLAAAERLTGSKFGFLGELNREGLMDTIAISDPGWDACKLAVSDARHLTRNMALRGMDRSTVREGKARIVNEEQMATHPDRVGVPEGHPAITAFLGVPLKHGGKTIGMIGLGNKPSGYDAADQEAVEKLSVAIVEALRNMRAERALREREKELAHLARVSTMGEMAAGIAHEVKQPLYAITNYATGITQHLQNATADSRDLTEAIEKITRQARRASDIIDRLRNTVQKREPHWSATDMNDLLNDLLMLVEHELRQENVPVDVDFEERLPLVSADAVQIQQVALNLIRNALDAMRGVSPTQRRLTLSTSAADGDAVEVGVGDTGMGLSDEVRRKVFDAFFTTKAEGLGMGLAISRRIVEAHEGRIWATPNSPHGTVFHFAIPTVPEKD